MNAEQIPLYIRTLLFGHVRFPYMKLEDLHQALLDPLVPTNLLAEGMLVRIANNEDPERATLLATVPRFNNSFPFAHIFA